MICPHCQSKTQHLFDLRERWCPTCGSRLWMNPDGTVRHVYIPRLQQIAPNVPENREPEPRGVHQ